MDLSIRSLEAGDIPQIRELLLANRPVFSDQECDTAIEMIEEQLALGPGQGEDPYQFLVAEQGGKVIAYACFGTIALTQGAYDLYWIAVHPGVHGSGAGKALLVRCEQEMAKQGGRIVVVETSSRKDYDKTRRFYEKTMQYEKACWIRDFYKPGDDKVVYVKYLLSARG